MPPPLTNWNQPEKHSQLSALREPVVAQVVVAAAGSIWPSQSANRSRNAVAASKRLRRTTRRGRADQNRNKPASLGRAIGRSIETGPQKSGNIGEEPARFARDWRQTENTSSSKERERFTAATYYRLASCERAPERVSP